MTFFSFTGHKVTKEMEAVRKSWTYKDLNENGQGYFIVLADIRTDNRVKTQKKKTLDWNIKSRCEQGSSWVQV
jgi:hypothetical protein